VIVRIIEGKGWVRMDIIPKYCNICPKCHRKVDFRDALLIIEACIACVSKNSCNIMGHYPIPHILMVFCSGSENMHVLNSRGLNLIMLSAVKVKKEKICILVILNKQKHG